MAASMFLEMRVKPGEQCIHRLRPDQVFAQQPDRPRVNNQPMQVETGKAHETRPVPDPKPGPLIQKAVTLPKIAGDAITNGSHQGLMRSMTAFGIFQNRKT